MQKPLRRLATTAALALVLGGLLWAPGASAAPAGAPAATGGVAATAGDGSIGTLAVGCREVGCDGKDPKQMGCEADARSLDGVTQHGAWPVGSNYQLDLRYSNACNAFWARLTNRNLAGASQTYYIQQCRNSSASTCSLKWFRVVPGNQQAKCCNSNWTAMVRGAAWVRACAVTFYSDGRPNVHHCTRTH